MFASPCTDHDNCPLDLKKLRADMRGEGLKEEMDAAEAAYKEAEAAYKAAYCTPSVQEKQQAAMHAREHFYFFRRLAWRGAEMTTLLCSIRAHHRGRLHGTRRRLPDGTKIEWTFELQEEYIKTAKPWMWTNDGQRLLERYCRNQPVEREVSAA